MASKSRSKHQGTKYAQYKTEQRWSKNRRRKLERHLRQFPEDAQAKAALNNIKYRRKTPNSSLGKSALAVLKVFKLFEGKASHNLVHSNPQVASAARMSNRKPRVAGVSIKEMYSIRARAHTGQGELVWQ